MKNPFKKSENTASGKLPNSDWNGKFSHNDKFWNEANKASAAFDKLEDSEFFMSVEDFRESMKYYTVSYLKTEWKNSFIEKRNAVNKKSYRFNFTITEEHVAPSKSAAVTTGLKKAAKPVEKAPAAPAADAKVEEKKAAAPAKPAAPAPPAAAAPATAATPAAAPAAPAPPATTAPATAPPAAAPGPAPPAKAAFQQQDDSPVDVEDLQLSAAIRDTEYQDEADEEDEDDDVQTQPEANEDDNDGIEAPEMQQKDEETDNENLAQLEKPHHDYINKEIDFEQQFA